jgi:lysophospholipase L1-like esterase
MIPVMERTPIDDVTRTWTLDRRTRRTAARRTGRQGSPGSSRTLAPRVGAALALLVAVVVSLVSPATSAGATPASISHVALGDSFSALDMDEYDLLDFLSNPCLRYPSAWPTRLAVEESSVSTTNVACSGATAATVGTSQVSAVEYRPRDLVTITVGGNDAGFSEAWNRCYSGDCATDPRASTVMVDKALPGVESLLARIRSTSPNSTVLLVGYPNLFDRATSCLSQFTQAEWDRARLLNLHLNDVLATAAARAGVHFVDVEPGFAGRGLCPSAGNTAVIEFRTQVPPHPNEAGHQLYADLVGSWLTDAFATLPTHPGSGMPLNPAPVSATSVVNPERCRTTASLRGWDKVIVTASGLPPSSTATITLRQSTSAFAHWTTLATRAVNANGRLEHTTFLPTAWPSSVGKPGPITAGNLVVRVAAGTVTRDVPITFDPALPPCDESPPVARVVAPAAGSALLLNQAVPLQVTCTDDRYPQIAGCGATADGAAIAPGTNVPTGAVGSHLVTASARDLMGTRTTQSSYSVRYRVTDVSPPTTASVPWTGYLSTQVRLTDANGVPAAAYDAIESATVTVGSTTLFAVVDIDETGLVRLRVGAPWGTGPATARLALDDGTAHTWTLVR